MKGQEKERGRESGEKGRAIELVREGGRERKKERKK